MFYFKKFIDTVRKGRRNTRKGWCSVVMVRAMAGGAPAVDRNRFVNRFDDP